jgi:hypothetical protein
VAEVTWSQRRRIADLMEKERYSGVRLEPAEREELSALQKLAAISESAPLRMVRQWADGALPDTPRRSMTTRQRQLATLEMRWPKPRLSGRQAVLELDRMKTEWALTPRQRQVRRMRSQ